MQKLGFDGWSDIRFRPDKAFLMAGRWPVSGYKFIWAISTSRPVTINVIREGIATPIPYSAGLSDYGRTKFDKPLPGESRVRRVSVLHVR